MAEERLELEKASSSNEAPLVRPAYPAGGYVQSAYGYGYGKEQSGLDTKSLWRLIRKRKWLLIVIMVIVTTTVTVEMYRTKSTYKATALVEVVKDSSAVIKSVDLVIQDQSDTQVPMVAMETKILFLKSRPLLEEVVVGLKLDKNPRFLEVEEKKSLWGAVKTIGRKFHLPLKADSTVKEEASEDDAEPQESARSAAESERLARYVNVLKSNLIISQVRNTRALSVSYTHTDPKIASEVTNGVVKFFIESSFKTKTEKFASTSQWLETTTRELKAKVEQAEQELANHVRDNNIFANEEGNATLTTDKLSRLHDQSTRAETDRILKQSLYEEVKAGRVAQLPEAFADTKSIELQKRLDELAVTAAQLDVKYGPDNPNIVQVRQQMATLQQQVGKSRKGLEEKLKADYERSVRDEAALKAALARAKAEAVNQNQAAIQMSILKQQVDTTKSLYNDFLQKTSQSKVQLAEQENNVRLIEPAPAKGTVVGPNRFRGILVGFFASLVAGLGLVLFLEYLDNTIKTVEDVNRYAQLPALGVIPTILGAEPRNMLGKGKGRKALPANAAAHTSNGSRAAIADAMLRKRSAAAEAYRTLRTSVLLSSAGGPPKTLLITSSQPGEGKTTTAANTAISLAQLGASVLIIDCDLRKPAVHKVFNVDHTMGLSTHLSRNIDLDKLIIKLPINNLSLLPCGPIPPNPAELISSDKMKKMLKELSTRYDHILLDSPPLIHVTDPVILSKLVDGVIMVVHGGKSTRDLVRRARQELVNVGAKIFGVVLNNVDLQREGYDDYYQYGYYYSNYGKEEAGRQV